MKKLFSILVAVLFAGSMMADPYTLTFNCYDNTGSDKSAAETALSGLFDAASMAYVDAQAAFTIEKVYLGRKYKDKVTNDSVFSNIKFGTSSAAGTLKFSLKNMAVDSVIFRAAMYGDSEGGDGFSVNGTAFTLSAGNKTFENLKYVPASSITALEIIQTKASKGRFYLTSITVYPSEGGEIIPPTPACDWDNIEFIGNGSGVEANTNRFKICLPDGVNAVNIQNSFGTEAGIYITFPSAAFGAISLEEGEYAIQGAGMLLYLSAFLYDAEKEVTIVCQDVEYKMTVKNVNPETVPVVPITCAEVYNMAKNDVVEKLNDVVVTYANGKNVWVRDASASMLIYLPANGTYAAGDTLSGVAGTVDIYNGVHEIKPTAAQVTAITAKAGVAPAAIPVENVQASDVNKYIVMQMVEAVGTFAEGTASNITINGVTVRNNFKNGYTFTADKTYNVYGVVTIYQSNPQVYFISAEEVPGMKGTYTVGGEGADFATLSAACDAIRTQGMRGNVDFVVCADIAETANIGITNTTKFTLTIRPNAAVKRTITFGDIADNVGPSGHVMIGYDMTGWACTDTKNVLIDGSFEGEGRYLEFQAGTVGGVIVVFYGHVEDALVKNCRLINARPSGTSYIGHFRSENSTKIAGSDKAPIMCGFHDCYMQVTNVANTQAIYYNGSQSATAAGKPQGCYVTGCEIRSNLRGIFFNGAIGATIADNTFIMESASAGFLAHAIMGNAQKGTIEVFGNRFINLKTNNVSAGDFGLQAITASGGASVWNIYNNYFAGLDALGSVADKAIKLCYIRCGDSCVVRHNSFYMPSLTNKPTTELTSATPIACLYLAGERKYIVENNLFVSAETTAHNSLIRGALNENVKNNVFFHNGGEAAILAGAVVAADSTAFFALEGTTGSAWAAPVFVDAANGNLDIAVANEALMMPQVADVLDDINGTARGEQTYAGAFEGPEPGQGTSLDMTEVEGVEKIFRNGQVLIIKNGKTYNMMGQVVE